MKSGSILTIVERNEIPPYFDRAELRLEALIPPVHSFEARFFAGEPAANANTDTSDNPHYLASQFFYGLGAADRGDETRPPYIAKRDSQSAPTTVRVNITKGLEKFLRAAHEESFPVTIVVVDRDGNETADADIDLGSATLVVS